MKKLLRGIVLSLVAVVALTGCLRIEGSFVLNEDDTIDGTFLLAVQKGVGDSMGMSDEDLLSQMTDGMDTGDLDGATVELYEDEDWVGQRVVFDSLPIAEASEDDAGLTVVREDGFFVVQGDPLASGSDGDEGDLSGLPGAEATMSVTFPGDVVETNGSVEGTTVTWDLLTLDEPMYAKGKATAGFSLPTWAWYAAGGVLLLGAVGIVLGVLLSRRRGAAVPYAPAPPAAAEGEGGTQAFVAQSFEPQSFAPEVIAPEQAPTEPLPYTPPTPSESWPGATPVEAAEPAPTEPIPTEASPWAPPQEPERP